MPLKNPSITPTFINTNDGRYTRLVAHDRHRERLVVTPGPAPAFAGAGYGYDARANSETFAAEAPKVKLAYGIPESADELTYVEVKLGGEPLALTGKNARVALYELNGPSGRIGVSQTTRTMEADAEGNVSTETATF